MGTVRVSVRAKVRQLALDEERESFERGFGSSSATTVREGKDCDRDCDRGQNSCSTRASPTKKALLSVDCLPFLLLEVVLLDVMTSRAPAAAQSSSVSVFHAASPERCLSTLCGP